MARLEDLVVERQLRVDTPFLTGGLAKQLGTREYCADRFFRRKLNRWLSEIKTLWPECPAAVSKDGNILVLNSSKQNPAVSCRKTLNPRPLRKESSSTEIGEIPSGTTQTRPLRRQRELMAGEGAA